MADDGPKSAFELVMERLRKKDAEAGVEQRVVTDEQKSQIAEIRSLYDSRLAQAEIMYRSAIMKTVDPVERAKIDEEYQRERTHLMDERETKITRSRKS